MEKGRESYPGRRLRRSASRRRVSLRRRRFLRRRETGAVWGGLLLMAVAMLTAGERRLEGQGLPAIGRNRRRVVGGCGPIHILLRSKGGLAGGRAWLRVRRRTSGGGYAGRGGLQKTRSIASIVAAAAAAATQAVRPFVLFCFFKTARGCLPSGRLG